MSQALQINPSATSSSRPVTAVHLKEAVDEEDWFRLLGRALLGVPEVNIVLDSDLFGLATGQDRDAGTRFLQRLPDLVGGTFVKVYVSSANVLEDLVQTRGDSARWEKLPIDDEGVGQTSRRQRKQRAGRGRGAARGRGSRRP